MMKLAVLSDIHSNNIALQVCIDYLKDKNIDGIVFLGDNVSDCPNPQKTLAMIKQLENEYQTWHVRGNREEYFIHHADGEKDGWCYSSYKGSLLYTYEHLMKSDIDMFRSYPESRVLSFSGMDSLSVLHGSPNSSRELLYADQENTKFYLKHLNTKYLLCGHSHRQFTYEYDGKLLINPGSIGVAIGKKAVVHFALLEWKQTKWVYELIGLPYDLEALKTIFEESSLMKKAYIWPKCILKSLETGINMGPLCAKRAYDMAQKEGVSVKDRMIPEEYWQRAAKELNIC